MQALARLSSAAWNETDRSWWWWWCGDVKIDSADQRFGSSGTLLISRFRRPHCMQCCRRKFRSQTSDNMDRWKAEQGRGREKRKIRREKSRRETVRRKKMEMREKVGKSRFTVFFPMICGSGGSKSRLAKAAGAEPAGQRRDEKLHAVVARSTFPSQNVKSTRGADHFWHLRCRKSARHCGAKHTSKWERTKHTSFGPLVEVEMSKKCTPLWREAHFQVKMLKALGGAAHFWRFRCRKSARRFVWQAQGILHLVISEQNVRVLKNFQLQPPPLHHTTLQYITLHYNYNYTFTTFYYTTLRYTTLHSLTLNYTTLHYITLHYTPLHYTTLHYTTLHYTTLPSTTLHYSYTTTLHYTPRH